MVTEKLRFFDWENLFGRYFDLEQKQSTPSVPCLWGHFASFIRFTPSFVQLFTNKKDYW